MNFIPKIEYTELTTGTAKTLTFESPPENDPLGEKLRVISKRKRSTDGTQQVQYNYILKEYNLEFLFHSESFKTSFQEFLENHAFRGGEFNYFIHSDEVDFETFTLRNNSVSFLRPIPAATPGEFEYDFRFAIEKVE